MQTTAANTFQKNSTCVKYFQSLASSSSPPTCLISRPFPNPELSYRANDKLRKPNVCKIWHAQREKSREYSSYPSRSDHISYIVSKLTS